MRLSFAACAAICLALAACGKPAEEAKPAEAVAPAVVAPTGFAHDATLDAAGFYKPVLPVQVNTLKLDHIAIGAPSDFAEWETGKREGVFGPILLQFDDLSSPTENNETGQNVHTVTLRVLPTSYRLYPGEVSFSATDPKIGDVVFDGKFDQTAFSEAHKSGSSGSAPVLTGNLKIGDNTIAGLTFTFFAGD